MNLIAVFSFPFFDSVVGLVKGNSPFTCGLTYSTSPCATYLTEASSGYLVDKESKVCNDSELNILDGDGSATAWKRGCYS